jgi:hypothetical protein
MKNVNSYSLIGGLIAEGNIEIYTLIRPMKIFLYENNS